MSFASSRTSTAIEINGLASANVGSVSTFAQNSTITLPLTLVSGATTTLSTLVLPFGVYTGYAEISVQGNATTVLDYMQIIDDDGIDAKSSYYLVATTLPDAGVFTFKYPLSIATFSTTTNDPIIKIQADFTGTALKVTAVSVYLAKVV